MFSFLRASPVYRLGVELGSQGLVGVMLDDQGKVVQRREAFGSTEWNDLSEILTKLLSHFPVQDCYLVMSLTQGYNLKVADLESRDPQAVRYEAERWLPYGTEEASLAWHALGPKSTLIMAYPTEFLNRLAGMLRPLKARSLAWEIREMVYARTLHQTGTPAGLVELSSDWLRLATACEGWFSSVSQYLTADTKVDVNHHVARMIDYQRVRWKSLPPPHSWWANAAALKSLQVEGLEVLPLPEDFVAVALANSPAGPHQFRL